MDCLHHTTTGQQPCLSLDPQIHFLQDVPEPLASKDFMIPDEYEPELIAEMCRLLGVRLRDMNLLQYGVQQEAAE